VKKRSKLSWISLSQILAIHEKLIALYGGGTGVRALGLLTSALSRAETFLEYEKQSDIFDLASIYADSIVNNHPFVDGNKRAGFIAAALFIETNGYHFGGTEVDVVTMTIGLADKSFSRQEYAKWLRESSELVKNS
jgi:death-on-curing protein